MVERQGLFWARGRFHVLEVGNRVPGFWVAGGKHILTSGSCVIHPAGRGGRCRGAGVPGHPREPPVSAAQLLRVWKRTGQCIQREVGSE